MAAPSPKCASSALTLLPASIGYTREACQMLPELELIGSSSTATSEMNRHIFTFAVNERSQSSGSVTYR